MHASDGGGAGGESAHGSFDGAAPMPAVSRLRALVLIAPFDAHLYRLPAGVGSEKIGVDRDFWIDGEMFYLEMVG